ncbi:MAG: CotH kinase family protein, partial [Bacteroidota bacterium]
EKVKTMMDVENFVDCWAMELYHAKGDHVSNSRLWRPRTPDGRWQSISFDHDHWKKPSYELIRRFINHERGKTRMFRFISKNPEFRIYFFNRLNDYLNTVFRPENVEELVWKAHDAVAEDKVRDRERWEDIITYGDTMLQIYWVIDYAHQRPKYLRENISEAYHLDGTYAANLDASPREGGQIQISTIKIDRFPWSGEYFKGNPIKVKAIPAEGYSFDGWEGGYPNTPELELSVTENVTLIAKFKKTGSNSGGNQ